MSCHHFVGQNLWSISIARVHCVASSSLFTQPGTIWLCSVWCQACTTGWEISNKRRTTGGWPWVGLQHPKEWFHEALRKLPMIAMIYRPGRGLCWSSSCVVFGLIAANETSPNYFWMPLVHMQPLICWGAGKTSGSGCELVLYDMLCLRSQVVWGVSLSGAYDSRHVLEQYCLFVT